MTPRGHPTGSVTLTKHTSDNNTCNVAKTLLHATVHVPTATRPFLLARSKDPPRVQFHFLGRSYRLLFWRLPDQAVDETTI